MGGIGSGRHGYATTPTVGECRHLTGDNFTDLLDIDDGREATLKWDATTNIRAEILNRDGDEYVDALRLAYTAAPYTDNATGYSYAVPVTYTVPKFRGRRPWIQQSRYLRINRCSILTKS